MDNIKCFDIASIVIDEAIEKSKGTKKVSETKLDQVKHICRHIDMMLEDHHVNSPSFSAEINDRGDMMFEIEMDELKMIVK